MARTRYKFLPDDPFPYFITATTVGWLPVFSNPDVAKIVFETLDFLQSAGHLTLFAYVLMENHLHLVAAADDLAKEIGNLKSFTARQSVAYYRARRNQKLLDELAERKLTHRKDRQHQFWQEGVHPQRISDREMLIQKVEYIHYNPVRRGYVEAPEHWRYSSARNYLGLEGLLPVCMDW